MHNACSTSLGVAFGTSEDTASLSEVAALQLARLIRAEVAFSDQRDIATRVRRMVSNGHTEHSCMKQPLQCLREVDHVLRSCHVQHVYFASK